jgi:non-heme chloroperoxidase
MTERLTHAELTLLADVPETPTRAPVLFVHGLTAGAWVFERWLGFFSSLGAPAYSINLRGHHDSKPVDNYGNTSLIDYADDVRVISEWIASRHGEAPALIGHSMGGLIVQLAAERGVGAAVVLMCSAPPRGILLFNPNILFKQLKYLPAVLGGKPFKVADEEQLDITFNLTPRAQAEQFVKLLVPESGRAAREITFGLLGVDASKVRVPVLSVGGAQDRFVPSSIAPKLAKKYGGEVRLYANHAHNLPGEPGWETPAGEIAEWIAAKLPRRADARVPAGV